MEDVTELVDYPSQDVVVPNVVGRNLLEAERKLREAHLRPVFFPTALSEIATAVVASLEPEAGQRVPAYSMVVVHPTDRVVVPVPDVLGWSVTDAVHELQSKRLRPVFASPLAGSQSAVVAALEPAAQVSAPVDSLVLIHPAAADLTVVPDVTDLDVARARQALRDANLVPAQAETVWMLDESSQEVVDYTVPPRGTSVQAGMSVKLVTKVVPVAPMVKEPWTVNRTGLGRWLVDMGPSPDPWTPG
jgi:beta-lactam-binding protein with PASTA domain